MDDFTTMTILSKLPPRVKMTTRATEALQRDMSSTVVENYVRDVVEAVELFDAEMPTLQTIMDSLFEAGVIMPVRLYHLKAIKLPVAVRKMPRFYARALKTLNGMHDRLVTAAQLQEAANREVRLRETDDGWGSDAAFEHIDYICYCLLASVGVDVVLLPPYKFVPELVKSNIDSAFSRAKAHFKW